MKKILLIASTALLLASCNSGETPANTANPALTPDTNKTKLTDDQWKERAAKNPRITETDNKTSPFKYAQTNAEFSTFGSLIVGSDYAKRLHNEDLVLLCPTNQVMSKLDQGTLVALKDPANINALNQFIGAHIIKPPFSVDKLELIGQATSLFDQLYPVDAATRTIKGASIGSYEVICENGKLVEMKGLISQPRFDSVAPKK